MLRQTAVEWFLEELIRCGWFKEGQINITLEQAKKIEMNNIINTYNDGYRDGLSDKNNETNDISEFDNAKLYFNEIYGKK